MHRIGRIGVMKVPVATSIVRRLRQHFGRRWRREDEWKDEEPERNPKTGAKQAADQKDD